MGTSLEDVKKNCSRCGDPSLRRQGNQWLCKRHYRFGQMRIAAKRAGKVVPEHAELETMVQPDNKCQSCNELMTWLASESQQRVVSLQHYRNGTMALVCRSCNTRHASMPGDTFCEMPKDHKRCPACEAIKHRSLFSSYRSRTGRLTARSHCRSCSSIEFAQWSSSRKKQSINQGITNE